MTAPMSEEHAAPDLRRWFWIGASGPIVGYLLFYVPVFVTDVFFTENTGGYAGFVTILAFVASVLPWLLWAIIGSIVARTKANGAAAGQFFLGAFVVPVAVALLVFPICALAA